MNDYISNKEFKETEHLYSKYKKLRVFESEIREVYKKEFKEKTNILDAEYLKLLEYEYGVINAYIKANSKENKSEEIEDLKRWIIKRVCELENQKILNFIDVLLDKKM